MNDFIVPRLFSLRLLAKKNLSRDPVNSRTVHIYYYENQTEQSRKKIYFLKALFWKTFC